MESLRLRPPPPNSSHLLRCPTRLTRPAPFQARKPTMPSIKATLSKPAADVSPGVTSRDSPLPPHSPPTPVLKLSPSSLQYPAGYLGAVPERTAGFDDGDNIINAMSYLTNILSSKVYDVAVESPLQLAQKLSERLGVKLWLKREDLQPVSFGNSLFTFLFLFLFFLWFLLIDWCDAMICLLFHAQFMKLLEFLV